MRPTDAELVSTGNDHLDHQEGKFGADDWSNHLYCSYRSADVS